MTPRERVLAVLSGRQPDRVPKMANFYPETLPELGERGAEGDFFGTDIRFAEFEPPPEQKAFLEYLDGLLAVGEIFQCLVGQAFNCF